MFAALFPGQGSQHVGMGKFLYDNFSSTKHLFEEVSDALSQNMQKLCFEGPEDQLKLTENTQPTLVLVGVATYTVLKQELALPFAAGAGHSVGEYAAAVCSGSITLAQACLAVRVRGRAMQEAVPLGVGGMLAVIGVKDEMVVQLCQWVNEHFTDGSLEPANFNAPGSISRS